MRMLRALMLLGLLLGSGLTHAASVDVPPLQQRVTDLTATLDAAQQQQLEQRLAVLEQDTGAQLAILMLPTTGDDSIEAYAERAFSTWKLGRKNSDDGVLLVLAKDDRSLRIEVGYGLEGTITDVLAGRIIRERMVPELARGDYFSAVQAGSEALAGLIEGNPLPVAAATPAAPTEAEYVTGPFGLFSFLGMLVLGPVLIGQALARLAPVKGKKSKPGLLPLLANAVLMGVTFSIGSFLRVGNPDLVMGTGTSVFVISLFIYLFYYQMRHGKVSVGGGGNNRGGRGGGGGFGGGGGGFRGGGGSSGGGGASGRW